MEKSITVVLGLVFVVFVSGCGRKGDPLPPKGEEMSYPLVYPAPDGEEPQENPHP